MADLTLSNQQHHDFLWPPVSVCVSVRTCPTDVLCLEMIFDMTTCLWVNIPATFVRFVEGRETSAERGGL